MSGVLAKMKTRTPNCSAFPFDFRNKFTSRIGELTPVACIEMGPNDRLKMSLAQLTRMMPLSAPAMANFQLHVDSVFVPARIVAKKYEKFFNAGTTDADRPYFPSLTLHQYVNVLVFNVGLYNKSILDYLGYPTFEGVKDFVRNMITSKVIYFGDDNEGRLYYYNPDLSVTTALSESTFVDLFAKFDIFDDEGKFVRNSASETILEDASFSVSSSISRDFTLLRFVPWLICYSLGVSSTNSNARANLQNFAAKYGLHLRLVGTSLDYGLENDLVEAYLKFENKNINELLDLYFSYVAKTINIDRFFSSGVYSLPSYTGLEQLIFCKDDSTMVASLQIRDHKISLLPIFSFWKCYFDWYVNSVLEHGEDLTDAWTSFVNGIISDFPDNAFSALDESFTAFTDGQVLADFFGYDTALESIFKLPSRLWSIDRFTGAYNDTQNGQVVRIPTDGTIRDLKASNVLQRYLEKALFGGTRTIDKNELIYGAHSSNQLLDRTEVLSRKKFNIDIQQVTNTAASQSFDLGTLAGNGFGMGGNFLFDYTCEERGYVMIFASVVLPPSYVQALDRNLLHTGYYDFVIPDFDTIGEQEILPEELYFDKGMNLTSGMYNRRYYEAIDFMSSVHGDFKNTLRHWHDARYFKNAPSLSPEFIRIDPENDDLERIFASYSHDQLLHFFAFSGVVVRPMSKFVTFGAI